MAKKQKYKRTVYQSFALISQFGITMVVPIFLCSFLGWYLDKQFQTSYLFIILFFIGALAGFRNIFLLSKKIVEGEEYNSYEEVRKSIRDKGEGKDENSKELYTKDSRHQ